MSNYETELAAAIERGRAILDERQRQQDERQRQQEKDAEERRQKHLAKLPEWARAFAATVSSECEAYINLAIPNCTPISLKSTLYRSYFDSACVSIPGRVEFRNGYWIVIFDPRWLDASSITPDIFDEAVAIAAGHYGALCQLQADADARNALPEDDSPYWEE